MVSAEDMYAEYVALIRDGFIPLEVNARRLALTNHFSLDPLEAALNDAYSHLLRLYIKELEQGRTSFAERAYELAKERNFPTVDIDNALARSARTSPSSH